MCIRDRIKSIHKKGARTKMKNKRGLFITNVISKVYERIIKERNSERAKLSASQTGGVTGRSTIDNTMVMLAIVERNKYLKKPTFITFADIEKCFDKLWLEDGLKDLWKSGMSARDCWALKCLNETARTVVETPVGKTDEIILKDTVRQGTVSGPRICGASMDNVNKVGHKVVTFYGPDIEIDTQAYVDDLESAGSCFTANNTIKNCNILEERKKLTVSIEKGKSGVLIVGDRKGSGNVTAKVKRGSFLEVNEEKFLGTWVDKTGNCMINIKKRKEKTHDILYQVYS